MQRNLLPLWLLTLITCVPFGSALAAEPVVAPLEVRCHTHKEILKADLSRLRARQSQFAIFADWKVMLSAGALWLSSAFVVGLTMHLLLEYPLRAWVREHRLLVRTINQLAMASANFIFTVENIGLMIHGFTKWSGNHLEKEIATIKD